MKLDTTLVDDTFAEGFGMRYARLVVTAHDSHWLDAALREFCGFASSVIACDLEIGCEVRLEPDATPDGRVGAAVLAFGFSTDAIRDALAVRVGQCLMTCPSTAVHDGLPDSETTVPVGRHIRFFGDGFQKSKQIEGRRYWRIPVMDGEFTVAETAGVEKGVAGGNIVIQALAPEIALAAARRAVEAVAVMPGVITPFPGGVARSGSKVGSRYKALKASTADAFCPTLRGRVDSQLHPDANVALEIVVNGYDQETVGCGMATAARAAAGDGVVAIGAGNYGGKLGPYHWHLREILAGTPA